ncbi:GerW family sporulation protein [Neobittarella massiliensis]|uniref:GerW family sporulation protein n=1 Tax=Neobittarella massiliensis (ex Bilen et al. 2018) TaxID=2041842 RepID=A0A8J6IL56_9FIRM|nr:GerW family sporulation protein [Neobittarella massiliensis]MBC3515469.1 GerW family sporulation protein [Neobittarella massiliensis]
MSEHPIQGLIDSAMNKIREMIDGNTVIGDPIRMGEDCVIIPVSKVSIGFASGGSDLPTKVQKDMFGGGSGGGLSVSPIGFLVVNKGDVRLMEFTKKSDTTADRLVSMVPDVVDKVTSLVDGKKDKKAPPPARSAADKPQQEPQQES